MPPTTPEEGQELEQLLDSIRDGDAKKNKKSVGKLREKGWLLDGTLHDLDLMSVDLSGCDLSHADLTEVYLRGGDLRGTDLQGAILSHANLSGVNLSTANLQGANLLGASLISAYLSADLTGADLRSADLRGADLIGAGLSDTDLRGADLRGVDLRGADLRGADLTGAVVLGANFTRAMCAYTTFGDIDLSGAVGLDTIQHEGPSTVGIDTLYRSRGGISSVFLLGCGVPAKFLKHNRGVFDQSAGFPSYFICYSEADTAFATQLHDTLRGQGLRCWLDEKPHTSRRIFRQMITQGTGIHDRIILVCSEAALSDGDWVRDEIEGALSKEVLLHKEYDRAIQEMKVAGKSVKGEAEPLALIPITLDRYLYGDYDEYYSALLMKRHLVSFEWWDHENHEDVFVNGTKDLIRALRLANGKIAKVPTSGD